jgi:hypothetical protein
MYTVLFKKLIVFVLALCLALPGGITVLAEEHETHECDMEAVCDNEDSNIELPINIPTPAPVISVSIPTSLPFVIDPFEINEMGTVFSDFFGITNHSEIDVVVNIGSLFYTLTNRLNEDKDLDLWITHDPSHDLPDIEITDAVRHDVFQYRLGVGESLSFAISGNIITPDAEWFNRDVWIYVAYTFAPALVADNHDDEDPEPQDEIEEPTQSDDEENEEAEDEADDEVDEVDEDEAEDEADEDEAEEDEADDEAEDVNDENDDDEENETNEDDEYNEHDVNDESENKDDNDDCDQSVCGQHETVPEGEPDPDSDDA